MPTLPAGIAADLARVRRPDDQLPALRRGDAGGCASWRTPGVDMGGSDQNRYAGNYRALVRRRALLHSGYFLLRNARRQRVFYGDFCCIRRVDDSDGPLCCCARDFGGDYHRFEKIASQFQPAFRVDFLTATHLRTGRLYLGDIARDAIDAIAGNAPDGAGKNSGQQLGGGNVLLN